MIKQQTLRTRRLFRDNNRALVVAMDHARVFETLTGLKDSNNIIKTVISAGADAILTPEKVAAAASFLWSSLFNYR